MDPDIPVPSVEHPDPSASSATTSTNNFAHFRDTTGAPLASSSPSRTPFRTPLSHPATPAPINTRSPSVGRHERHSSPRLPPQRSSSSLSVSRGQTPSRMQLRRVSSNLNPSSPTVNTKPPEMPPIPPALTASSVAKEFFQRELAAHANVQPKTMVLVHDSCYGHRFSRPRSSKAALATIVERPERIHATLLGASTAYVQLGERHCDGANSPHPDRDAGTLSRPPFTIRKTTRTIALNHPAVTHIHGAKWMEELQIMCDSAESKLAMNGKELQRPIGYGKDEKGNPLPKLHEGDLYLSSESLAALQGCLGGVCDAVDTIFTSDTRRAFVCIRPPGHHCSSNYPSGFCWLNNVHVGISYAAMNYGLTHAAIIDFDLHHGDGSQTVAWDHNRDAQALPKNAPQHKKTPIGYYSLHDINSYPCEWGDEDKVRNASLCIENAHGQSIWNVHLEPWTSLEHFWKLYEAKYFVLLEKTRLFLKHHTEKLRAAGTQAKAAIFISAGFDASQWEGQGMQRHNVNVPTEFYARFTSDIVRLSHEADLGVDGRVISVLEGGYSDRALTSGVLSHLCGLTANDIETVTNPHKFGNITDGLGNDSAAPTDQDPGNTYDPAWWDESSMEALESRVAGNIDTQPAKKVQAPGNYASPTHAFTAKMTEVARERKSLTSQLENRLYLESVIPDPPPPVDWVIASYELSRILIPSDRQTLSCRHDELNAEATKVRRERQSATGVPASSEQRMQLRTRTKAAADDPTGRAASRTGNRRTTIAAVSELPDSSVGDQVPRPRSRRRSSAASSVLSSFQDMKLDDRSSAGDKFRDSRPTSVAPNPNKELVTKKARMPPPAKRTVQKVSNSERVKENPQATVSAAPPLSKTTTRLSSGAAGSRLSSQTKQGGPGPSHDRDHMDDLTNGMKKVSIKLKMPTPEQHVENQRKAEEAKLKKARVTKKPAVPKASKVKAETTTATVAQPSQEAMTTGATFPPAGSDALESTPGVSRSRDNVVASEDATHIISGYEGASQIELDKVSDSSPRVQEGPGLMPPPSEHLTHTSNGLAPSSSSSSSSNGMTHAVTAPSDGALPTSKASLPTFTSTSRIPFAGSEQKVMGEPAQAKPQQSIWEIPGTPQH